MIGKHPLRRLEGSRLTIRIGQTTWRGTLAAYSAGWLMLRQAQAIDPVTGSTNADGLILLPEDRIEYCQAIQPDGGGRWG